MISLRDDDFIAARLASGLHLLFELLAVLIVEKGRWECIEEEEYSEGGHLVQETGALRRDATIES